MSILANMWFVLLGLAEKIRYLFVYDKQDVIMYPAKQVNVLQKHSSKKISVDEEKEEMEGDATELTVLSYNINRLFAYHDPKKIERTIEFFNALFQLPWRSTKPTQASSLAAPVDATIDTSGCNVTQAPDVICVQEAWEESVSSRLLQIAAMHGWYAARPSTVKRLFVGEATGKFPPHIALPLTDLSLLQPRQTMLPLSTYNVIFAHKLTASVLLPL